jgi:DNA invertase Pin-like site-specific DNA recombinase
MPGVTSREERPVLDHHIEALTTAGCEGVFDDAGSRTGAQRPGLAACLYAVQRGDVLVVLQLHHLGRRVEELIHFVDELKGRGVGFRALDTLFDTTAPTGNAFLQIHAEFAEMERNVIRQRISEGLAAARARGRNGGRPRLMTPERIIRTNRRPTTSPPSSATCAGRWKSCGSPCGRGMTSSSLQRTSCAIR